MTACGSGVEPGNEARPDDPLNTWRAYVVRVTETGAVRWQATHGSRHANNAAEFVLPTRDGGFAVVADSDEHGVGEGANFATLQAGGRSATWTTALPPAPAADQAQPSAASNAVTLRVSRLNSTPIRWIGSPRPRYFAA